MDTTRWLDDESRIQQAMFGELEGKTRQCFDRLCGLEGGLALIRFLHQRANTLLTADDIAYHLRLYPYAAVARSLQALAEMGLVRHVRAGNLVLFGLTEDPKKRELVHALYVWQDRWLARVDSLQQVIKGQARQRASQVRDRTRT